MPSLPPSQALEYMHQLAIYMVKVNRTKLAHVNKSDLFVLALEKRSLVDIFFSEKPHEKAVREAVPVRMAGGFLMFAHKTLMEHSVAVAVIEGIEDAVQESGLTPQELVEVVVCHEH